MIFNLVIIFITIILGFIFSDPKLVPWDEQIKRKRYIWIISLVLVLQSGLRHVAVGADTYAYYLAFERVKHMDWDSVFSTFIKYYESGEGKDPGYVLFEKVAQIVSKDYQCFLFLIAIIFFIALGSFIYKNTNRLSDAVFAFTLYSALFYSFFSITGHRQTVATAIVLFSFEVIKKRKFLIFLLLILLASTMHRSSLIVLPFYFIYSFKPNKFLFPIALIGFLIIMVYRVTISDTLRILGGYSQSQYGVFESAGTYTFTAMLLFVSFIAWWRMKYVLFKNEEAGSLYNAFILAIVFTPLTWVNPNAMRIVQYYSIFLLVLLPAIIESFSSSKSDLRRIAYTTAIIGIVVLAVRSGWDMEYKFFWQQMELGPNYFNWANVR